MNLLRQLFYTVTGGFVISCSGWDAAEQRFLEYLGEKIAQTGMLRIAEKFRRGRFL